MDNESIDVQIIELENKLDLLKQQLHAENKSNSPQAYIGQLAGSMKGKLNHSYSDIQSAQFDIKAPSGN